MEYESYNSKSQIEYTSYNSQSRDLFCPRKIFTLKIKTTVVIYFVLRKEILQPRLKIFIHGLFMHLNKLG